MDLEEQQNRLVNQFHLAASKIERDVRLHDLTRDEILSLISAVSEREELIRWLLAPLEPRQVETMEGGDWINVQPMGYLTVSHSIMQGRHLDKLPSPSNDFIYNQFIEGYKK